MNKYKIVGIINIAMGVIFLGNLFSLAYRTAVIAPQRQTFYSDVTYLTYREITPTFIDYFILGLIFLIGIGNLFLGIKLLKNSQQKEKYFKFGAIFLGINCVCVLIFFILTAAFTTYI